MNILSFIFKLFTLVPIIANGVHTVQADLTPGGLTSKLNAASDALSLASEGSIALLPVNDQAQATQIAGIAQNVLATAVTDLHNAAQPGA